MRRLAAAACRRRAAEIVPFRAAPRPHAQECLPLLVLGGGVAVPLVVAPGVRAVGERERLHIGDRRRRRAGLLIVGRACHLPLLLSLTRYDRSLLAAPFGMIDTIISSITHCALTLPAPTVGGPG